MSPSGLLVDPLRGRPMGERARRALSLAFAATWVLGVAVLASRPAFYPAWFSWGANALLALAVGVTLATWRAPVAGLWATQAVVVLAALVRAVEAVVLRTPHGFVDYPPLTYVLTMALGATGVVFRPRVGLPLVGVNLAGLLAERLQVVGALQSVAEVGYIASAGLAGFLVVRAVRIELDDVERASATTHRRRNDALLARERTELRERWDALVHDTVLSSLTLAARGEHEEASALAAAALDELDGSHASPDDPAEAITRHAARLGLDLRLVTAGWPAGARGDALVVACCEALTNVARHSGRQEATVSTEVAAGAVSVVVADDGRGFDPTRVDGRRLGLRQAIEASMRAVGGTSEIDSSPGGGTRVVLRVPAEDGVPAATADGQPWGLASLTWLAVVFAVQIASGVAIGALYLQHQAVAWISIAGMVLLPALTALLAFLPTRRPWWPASLLGTVVVWAALLGNVEDFRVIDWRTWFIGTFDTAIALVALRDRLRTALAVVASATVAGSVVLVGRGVFSAWPIIEGTYQTVIWGTLAGLYRHFMDGASAQVAEEAASQADSEREELSAAARDQEIRHRRQSLDAEVVPMLRRLASGAPLTGADRRRCTLLEATTRDQLAAATLLTRALAASLRSARERGVGVAISGRRDPGTGLAPFHEVALRMLAVARPGDRIRLSWQDTPEERSGSACLVGPDVGRMWRAGRITAGPRIRSVESVDDESVLVEFAAL